MPELSRKDKETARTIIEKGLQKEIENGIGELESLGLRAAPPRVGFRAKRAE